MELAFVVFQPGQRGHSKLTPDPLWIVLCFVRKFRFDRELVDILVVCWR